MTLVQLFDELIFYLSCLQFQFLPAFQSMNTNERTKTISVFVDKKMKLEAEIILRKLLIDFFTRQKTHEPDGVAANDSANPIGLLICFHINAVLSDITLSKVSIQLYFGASGQFQFAPT